MSVVVMGMEMPEDCTRCPFGIYDLCFISAKSIERYMDSVIRPWWCPLREIKEEKDPFDGWSEEMKKRYRVYLADLELIERGKRRICPNCGAEMTEKEG